MFRVIELGHIVAGPTTGLILAEMGFDVIKVERPGSGDISRNLTGESAGSFPYYNRNKKSVEINTKSKLGKEALIRLVRSADVLIDNFSSGFMKNLGMDYERLKVINPRLIYAAIRGYSSGKNENRKSLDYPIEIDSGIAYMNGLSERPMRVGASLVDMFSASTAVIGIYDALLKRQETGKGCKIESSLFSNAMFMIGQHISTYQVNGKPLKPLNEAGFAWGIYDFFITRDQKNIFVAVTTDEQWRIFCSVFNIEKDIAERFQTNRERFLGRDELIPYIARIIGTYEAKDIEKIFIENSIVYSFLRKPWDLLEDPDCVEQMHNVDFNGTQMKLPGIPVGMNEIEVVPPLGNCNVEILESIGFSQDEIRIITKE